MFTNGNRNNIWQIILVVHLAFASSNAWAFELPILFGGSNQYDLSKTEISSDACESVDLEIAGASEGLAGSFNDSVHRELRSWVLGDVGISLYQCAWKSQRILLAEKMRYFRSGLLSEMSRRAATQGSVGLARNLSKAAAREMIWEAQVLVLRMKGSRGVVAYDRMLLRLKLEQSTEELSVLVLTENGMTIVDRSFLAPVFRMETAKRVVHRYCIPSTLERPTPEQTHESRRTCYE